MNRVLALLCCLTACDLAPTDEDVPDDDASTGEGESESDSTGDDTNDDDTNDTSDPPSGDALPDSVILYLRDDGSWADSVHAYDVANDTTWLVTDLGGDVQMRSIAIHPDRTSIAISAYYESETADESEGIWRVGIDGGAPDRIMAPIDGEGSEGQNVANLAYSWDGTQIWFDYSNGVGGGGLIARVADSGGVPELFGEANGGCIGNATPAPGPSGVQLFSIRKGCSDFTQQGLVVHDLPPQGAGQVVLSDGDLYEVSAVPPQWTADGTAAMFVMSSQIDFDGDGFYEGEGEALILYDTVGGGLAELVPVADGQRIWNFAVAPDETGIVLCLSSAAGYDLVLMDLTGETASYRQLTADGVSCRPAW